MEYATREHGGHWTVRRVDEGSILQTCPPAPTGLGETCSDEQVQLQTLGTVASKEGGARLFYVRTYFKATFASEPGPFGTVLWGPPTSEEERPQIVVAWPKGAGNVGRSDVAGGTLQVGDSTVRLATDGTIHFAVTEAGEVHNLRIGAP